MTEKKSTMLAVRLFLLLSLLALTGRAGTWVLVNGDRLGGELVEEGDTFVVINHPNLGRLKIDRTALRPAPAEPQTDPLKSDGLAKEASADKLGGLAEDDESETPAATATTGTAAKPERKKWRRSVELGYSQQSGTKEKQDLSLRVQVDGKEGANTYRGTLRVLQAAADGKTVTERQEADFRWRHDITKRLFTQALTTYAADGVRGIDLSLEQQVGGGYRIIDRTRHKANVGVGAVLQYLERQDTEDQTALLGSIFQDYAYQWNRRVKLVQEASFMISDKGQLSVKSGLTNAPAEGSYRLRFNTGVQSKVTNQMSLNVRFEYDYDRSVVESALRADQRLTTSLGYLW